MRPRERQETGEQDLFRSRLDRIIDLTHALVKLSSRTTKAAKSARLAGVFPLRSARGGVDFGVRRSTNTVGASVARAAWRC